MVKIQMYPQNSDGTPMKLMVAMLTDAGGNGGRRLVNVPTGPDGAPIDAFGIVIVDTNGNLVDIDGGSVAVGGAVLNGQSPPTGSIGFDGDFYIEAPPSPGIWKIYGPKANKRWPPGVPLMGASTTPTEPTPVGPGIVTAPLISLMGGTLNVGGILMFNDGQYTGTPTPTLSLPTWLRNGAVIPGESDYHYTLTVADEGANISARQQVQNATATIQVDSNTLGPIGPAVPGPSPISAPVLTQTSADGAAPFTWQAAVDNTVAVGDIWRLQVAQEADFDPLLLNATKIVSPAEFEGGATSFADWLSSAYPPPSASFNTPSGEFWMRMYVERYVELTAGNPQTIQSPASNVLNEIITAASTVLHTVTGVNKNQYLNMPAPLSSLGANRSFQGTNGVGANMLVRATNPVNGKRVVELKILAFNGEIVFGVSNGTEALGPTVYPNPGETSPGANIRLGSVDTNFYRNGGAASTGVPAAVDDIIAMEIDTVANTIAFFRNSAGSNTTIVAATTLTSQIPATYYVIAGTRSDGQAELNFGQEALVRTPTATFLPHG